MRARAHALKPVVRIGANGPTEGVVRELERALDAHELVKIHAASDDRNERARLLVELCREVGAQPVQNIGKMLVAYRPRPPEKSGSTQPAVAPRPAAARGKRPARAAPSGRKVPARARREPPRKGSAARGVVSTRGRPARARSR